ncbi:histidyl-tRNA synthetase [Acidiphilium sp. MT5]
MSKLQPPRGTQDLIGPEARRHAHIISTAQRIAALYGAEPWSTPIFEATAVFSRNLGETSDIVTREMYNFADRGGDSLTLRPEGTAGICRALVTNGLTQSLPQKIFYAGPMFRYERPQKGRYRQFHQIGFEILGAETALADAEAIACAATILHELGITEGVTLNINTLGDPQSRDAYRAALITYFTAHAAQLSADSQTRLEKNPLRILDSKDPADIALVANAPTIAPYLTQEAASFYAALKSHLTAMGVAYIENPGIVRGLDYYNHTAFEFVTTRLGAQGTVLAGGRYDGLVEQLGGPAISGIGWGAGIERLAMLIAEPPAPPAPIIVIPIDATHEPAAISLLTQLRRQGIAAEMNYRGNLKRRLERANKTGANWAILVGPESSTDQAALKNLADGTQQTLPIATLLQQLAPRP